MILTLQRTILRLAFIAAALLSYQTTHAGSNQPAPVPKLLNGNLSEDGHIKVSWDNHKEGTEVELQQAENEYFNTAKMIYRGPDKATFISGLENGTYYYRIRRVGGAWSDPVKLTVKHHSLQLAFILFSLGAVVFILTVFIVVKGALHASTD